MNFSQALEFIKHGNKLQREGWNGKGMYLVYKKGYPEGVPISENASEATGIPRGTVCKFQPYIMMYTTHDNFVPWVASQSDLLSDDWNLVHPEE